MDKQVIDEIMDSVYDETEMEVVDDFTNLFGINSFTKHQLETETKRRMYERRN
jgi:hypothetical protein